MEGHDVATELARSWADAHAKAAAAESRLCSAIVRQVRGEGEGPGVVLKEHALLLRRHANELRDALAAQRPSGK
jgi:hypothetical protein